MNKTIKIICTLLAPLLFQSCFLGITGSGVIEEVKYEEEDFTRVHIGDAFSATIEEGKEFDVRVEIDDNLTHRLEVRKSGETLYIGLKNGNIRKATLRATIVLPKLNAFKAEDAVRAELTGIQTDGTLKVTAEDASKIEGTVFVKKMELNISDASSISLKGSADALNATVEDASRLSLQDISLLTADVRLRDASRGTITVSDTLSANLSDASSLSYYGTPSIKNLQTSDASSIQRKD